MIDDYGGRSVPGDRRNSRCSVQLTQLEMKRFELYSLRTASILLPTFAVGIACSIRGHNKSGRNLTFTWPLPSRSTHDFRHESAGCR